MTCCTTGMGALAVEPGDAQPVLDCLQRDGLQLGAILVTPLRLDDSGNADAPKGAAAKHGGTPAAYRGIRDLRVRRNPADSS